MRESSGAADAGGESIGFRAEKTSLQHPFL